MTREQVTAYRSGWSTVKALELEEAKLKSVQESWRELNALYNFAYELGLIDTSRKQNWLLSVHAGRASRQSICENSSRTKPIT